MAQRIVVIGGGAAGTGPARLAGANGQVKETRTEHKRYNR
jgi:hypothetical protein